MNETRKATRKVSVFLPAELHRKLKVIAAQRETSIQEIMASAAELIASPPRDEEMHPAVFEVPALTPERKKELELDVKNILDSGDPIAIYHCAATTEVMKLMVEQHRRQGAGSLLVLPSPLQSAVATESGNLSSAKSRPIKKAR